MQQRRRFLARTLSAAVLAGSLALATTAAFAEGNVLRIATDATFPPMEFVENG
jgi:polar amino acid transport system substrate-binding protein